MMVEHMEYSTLLLALSVTTTVRLQYSICIDFYRIGDDEYDALILAKSPQPHLRKA